MKKFQKIFDKSWSPYVITFFCSLIVVLFLNTTFFAEFFEVYPLSSNLPYALSIGIGLILLNIVLMRILSIFFNTKFSIAIFLLISTFLAYFTDSYGIIVDETMLINVAKTDPREMYDLISWKLFLYLIMFTVVPCVFLVKIKITTPKLLQRIKNDILVLASCLLGIFLLVLISSKFYASFFREHKEIRYRVNPTHAINSIAKFLNSKIVFKNRQYEQIGLDAKVSKKDHERDLVILVLGETARSDHFSLNGYERKTNPLLEKEKVISFTNMFSCGTSTAHSVPCMFELGGAEKFEPNRIELMDNVLDVLAHTREINILWRDNNSDSKGVALRVNYQDFKSPKTNTICDTECRDEGLLVGLQKHIDSIKVKDILIVLHQMGSHGPAYYKRYPAKFEKYLPVCKTNELEKCSIEEIKNAYDNTILYTDYFLSKTIELLKNNSKKFETALFYISDHGESLGENGVYLHSLPNFIAPKAQKHVPAIMWFGGHMQNEISMQALSHAATKVYTHDYFFNTLLGLFEVETKVYNKKMDILAPFYQRTNE